MADDLKGTIWRDKRYGNRMRVERVEGSYVYGKSLIRGTSRRPGGERSTRIMLDEKTGGPRGYVMEET